MTQVASVSTNGPTLRSEIEGWTFEDSDLLVRKEADRPGRIFIGFTPSPRDLPHYETVLEMLADGWDLLGPPTDESWTTEEGKPVPQWGWWLTRKARP
jgi:hypothetical protein